MTQKDLNNWFMYHELQRLHRLGFSKAKIAKSLAIDPRTASKYISMTEAQFEHHLESFCERKKILSAYEAFIADKLSEFSDTSAAQVHDWLKESYPDFPNVSARTVYNYVMFVRQKYNIPVEVNSREFFPVEELPYGQQAQVDFGTYNMRTNGKTRKKVMFFAMVMSRSRMKFIWFEDNAFTAKAVISAHEKAFEFFCGIPNTIVYDQDRTMVVSENLGEIILASEFKQYTKSRKYHLHFCRKADPQSKGKVENVVQYVKKNFLYNRLYSDISTLNTQSLGWLGRTANHLPHNVTKKSPESEFAIERGHLQPFKPMAINIEPLNRYTVRKDSTVNYKGNFYTLPSGTYKSGKATTVLIKEKEEIVEVYTHENNLLCSHTKSLTKGKTVRNTNHKRDTTKSLDEMMEQAANHFPDKGQALGYLSKIRKKYPRYARDHFQLIIKLLKGTSTTIADKALNFCLKNEIFNASEWEHILAVYKDGQEGNHQTTNNISLLDKESLSKAGELPQQSNINDYENILNK